jgi:hypothetical protein
MKEAPAGLLAQVSVHVKGNTFACEIKMSSKTNW